MQLKQWILVIVGVVLVLGLAACGGAPQVEWSLEIAGGSTPVTLSYADLVDMPQTDLKDVLMQKSLGENETASWSGVPITEIFAKAGVTSFSSVTATAADGYAVEISADEMQDAIVALKKGGDWITQAEPDKGPIRLVCPETPANRWVFQVQTLQVNP
jgi:DMSO/TMAO reductase YedYZ molybdopterin-dependent catalytic subunit